MTVAVELGVVAERGAAAPAVIDIEELLATRLLVQGNSGSGKSHLLRRLLEKSAPHVQQTVIDPEGDFVSLADRFGHLVVDADRSEADLVCIAERVRERRVSCVLNLENLEAEQQLRAAAIFLNALFEAERAHWFPMLVVVDEAQLFAPAAAGEISEEARRASLGAMTNLMCRGRKRGLAGVIATQRLAKLAKNVAAEASNFLMGRTFLDIDMQRAADLLGLERRQAEVFRELDRGRFVALGPALSRRPLQIAVGSVETVARGSTPSLTPPPAPLESEDRDELLAAAPVAAARPAKRRAPPPPADELLPEAAGAAAGEEEAEPGMSEAEREATYRAILADILSDPEATFRPEPVLFQDFLVHCRIRRVGGPRPDLAAFRSRLVVARAGVPPAFAGEEGWAKAEAVAAEAPEELRGVYLLLARAARERLPCPSDLDFARVCASHSPARGRSRLQALEQGAYVVLRTGMRGGRIVVLPDLGWETAPGDPAAPAGAYLARAEGAAAEDSAA
ncbi:MAG TPA: ATP-binding protein [Beijerinckiaceae bacterium]